MKSTLDRILIPSLAASLLLPAACQGISRAPEGSPRVELEVVVNIDDQFLGALEGADVHSKLVRSVEETILSLADAGLRFYPVPSSAYGKGQSAEYVMTVDVRELDIQLDHEMIENGDDASIETRVDWVVCKVAASIERRRADRPSLIVGRSTATAGVRAESRPEVLATEAGYSKSGSPDKPLKVTEQDILDGVERSFTKALRALAVAIDREFSAGTAAGAP